MHDRDTAELRLEQLLRENARLRAGIFDPGAASPVSCPPELRPLFDRAAAALREHFGRIEIDSSRAMIGIDRERYVLVRASAFSIDFLDTLVQLYADRGQREALAIGRGFLFDIAHTIGLHDARTLHESFNCVEPHERLSFGPVHFAYTGWALVDIKSQSKPLPNDDFCLVYDHPYSFEADSWLRAGRSSEGPVCIMSAGYSSGWCEASYGIELTAIEVTCKARGDATCTFVMAPPHRVAERVHEHFDIDIETLGAKGYDIPTYFERKRVQEAQDELVRKERLATVGLLVAGVAHEVNTPLGVAVTAMSVINEDLELLKAQFDCDQLTRSDLRAFLERASRAGEMVRSNLDRAATQITNFKRVSVDQVTQERRHIDVGEYVRQTLDNLGPVIRKHGLEVSLATSGDLEVDTHPGALAQIITNFVTNTATHGRDEGSSAPLHVQIRIERTERGKIVLSYADDGQGMSHEVHAQAFQPFFTTARGRGGTGLGLHIVHSLVVDVLGGRIDLSTSPGEGVRYDVEFNPNFAAS